MTELDYAGDLDPQKAWDLLEQNKDCYLVDCRTNAEWNYVGVPDLYSIGKNVLFIEWQTYPLMEKNNNFLQEINDTGIPKDAKLIFICRSGARSRSAAEFLTHRGYKSCYNLSGGFEGNHDSEGHRGNVSGWKQKNLPWKQG